MQEQGKAGKTVRVGKPFSTSFTIFHYRRHGNIPGYHYLTAWIEFNKFISARIFLVLFHSLDSK